VHRKLAPDGGDAYSIECRDPDDCRAEAQRICPDGYAVLSAGERVTGATAQALPLGQSTMILARPTTRDVMVIQCD